MQTLIDLIFTNTPVNITEVSTFALSFSAHDMIGCSRKINHQKYDPKIVECRDYKNYNPEAMCDEIKNIELIPLEEITDINIAVDYFNTKVTEVFDRHAPKTRKHVKGKQTLNDRDRLLKKAHKTKSENDWSRYKILHNHSNSLIKKAKSTYHKTLISENETNPRKFWDAIKNYLPE